MKVGKRALALTILLAAANIAGVPCLAAAEPATLSFPGKARSALSPSGRYEVRIAKVTGLSDAPTYRLRLNDLRHHTHKDIATFERSVALTWRTGGEGFFLNQYSASNYADCAVAMPNERTPLRSLMAPTAAQGELGITETVTNSHYYVECLAWNGPNEVRVRVYGHHDDDGKDFAYALKYDVRTRLLSQ
jgi:hypothetical protein